MIALEPFLPCRTKPSGETMGIDAPLRVLEDFIPEIHEQIRPYRDFHRCGNTVETQIPFEKSF